MPMFEFQCKCGNRYDEMSKYDETGVFAGVICPECNSEEKTLLISATAAPIFSNPRGTSKQDSFTYRAGYNMEQAKETRRIAEEKSHMGTQPYTQIDDVSSGKFEGTVK